ncbi:myeloid-associated differentiation marker-like [Bos indicus]|uniref:Myeloid-associated differentiation marker-like n=1 Tax=Bos indicus TaxID=9915 RepID=A0ABM4R8Y5_BOSIN
MFIWCIWFTVTLTIFIVEFCELRSRLPFSWGGFLCAHAFYFSITCLSKTIIFGATYIKFLPPGSAQNRVITATAFAFVTAVLYAIEAFCIISSLEAWSGSSQPSRACAGGQRTMLTGSSSPSSAAPTSISISQPYVRGCVLHMLPPGRSCELHSEAFCSSQRQKALFPTCILSEQTVLSVLLYPSALVLCQLHQFNKKPDGQPQWSSDVSCSNRHTCLACGWDQRLAVAVLSSCCLMWLTLSAWTVRLL